MTRHVYDYYPTPEWCYTQLPIEYSHYNTALEPCAGDYRIVSFMSDKGLEVDACEIQEGEDFLLYKGNKVDLILTNPPFSLAIEFIEKSMSLADTTIMLLRLNFLGSQKRKTFWLNNEPDALFILSKRPSFTGNGTDSTEYAWFVWQKGIKHIKPGIYHI